jgi:hypothetical protein
MSSSVESALNLLLLQKYVIPKKRGFWCNVCELGGGEDTHHERETFDVPALERINPNAAQLLLYIYLILDKEKKVKKFK